MEVTVRKSALGRNSRRRPRAAPFAIGQESPRLISACTLVNLPSRPDHGAPRSAVLPNSSAPALTARRRASWRVDMPASASSLVEAPWRARMASMAKRASAISACSCAAWASRRSGSYSRSTLSTAALTRTRRMPPRRASTSASALPLSGRKRSPVAVRRNRPGRLWHTLAFIQF